MRKRNEAVRTSEALSCSYCHHGWPGGDLIRHVHWLKVYDKCSQDTSQELYPHLQDQYPHNGDAWAASVLAWCHTMRSLWGDMVDDNGIPMPLWKAWIAKKQIGTKLVQGEIPF